MTGETINEVVRRIRLARGAAVNASSITEAAGEAAYATSQSFARSMRSYAGMSISEAVQRPDIRALFAPPVTDRPLAIELVDLQPVEVIAIRNRGSFADLDELFGRLFEIAGGPAMVEAIYGVYVSDPRFEVPEQCELDAALKLSVVPTELTQARLQRLEGGHFVRLRHLGNYDAIPLALDALTFAALTEEGLELRDAPPTVHYLDDPEETSLEKLRSDIHLPVNVH
jgi:AraC family transcriptional regulator